jgi:hypothetical protein
LRSDHLDAYRDHVRLGRAVLVAALVVACSRGESPVTSDRCQRLIQADAAARAAWEQARAAGETQDLLSGLRRAFEEHHDELSSSGCLTS